MTMTMIGAAAVLALSPALVCPAWAETNEQAVAFVKDTADRLVAIVNSPGAAKDKRGRLKEVLDLAVDVDDIARFCLGRFWHIATPDQQKQYTSLFRDLLVTEITNHFGEYQGVRVTMGLARASADTEIVITIVDRPGTDSSHVDWVVSTASGGPKVVDLLSSGVSLRLSQSEDFASYLAHHEYNIQALIEAMRQMVAQSG
jgi:phospholipid transport system substrate-binding protein